MPKTKCSRLHIKWVANDQISFYVFTKGHEEGQCKNCPDDLCKLERLIFGQNYQEKKEHRAKRGWPKIPYLKKVMELLEYELKSDKKYQDFVQIDFKSRPLMKLHLEDALSGGINEVRNK